MLRSVLVGTAKAGDTARQQEADRRWHENADEVATFPSAPNPNWPKDTVLMMADALTDGIQKQFPDRV